MSGVIALQLLPSGNENILMQILLIIITMSLLILYGGRLQLQISLMQLSSALNKLKHIRDASKREVVNHLKDQGQEGINVDEAVDKFIEYFVVYPVDIEPTGLVSKIEFIFNQHDERLRYEVAQLVKDKSDVNVSKLVNMVEVATALNQYYKVVRHYYLLSKKTSSLLYVITLQNQMPQILQEASALLSALEAFKAGQPIGDSIGPIVVGRLMYNRERVKIEKDTVMSQVEYKGRQLYLLKAEGPGGNVGDMGNATLKLVNMLPVRPSVVIMIDAALKLEGEASGSIAEGTGAVIGGLGTDRFKIEEICTKYKIPLYGIVVKESLIEAITVIRKEIFDAVEGVIKAIYRVVEQRTKEGDNVIIIGVGNTIGVL
ncbi:MAG: DUF1512 domain-containing protein [Nitrososphaerota archaeon]